MVSSDQFSNIVKAFEADKVSSDLFEVFQNSQCKSVSKKVLQNVVK